MSKLDQIRALRENSAKRRHDLRAQIRRLGADSLLPDWKPPIEPIAKRSRKTGEASKDKKPWERAGMSRATWYRRKVTRHGA